MGLILEVINNILVTLQEPASKIIVMFPGTIITLSLFSFVIRRNILYLLRKRK